ncbi:MAG TPA: hypothetical protein VMU43_06780 [Candidatus Acidoferrum sp.]|nr:hypothetical protein [Candidatus Acidoferrum sp.]
MKRAPSHLILSSAGSYPRIGAAPEMLHLDETWKAFQSGSRTTADLVDAQNAMARRAIAEQVEAGLEIVTDGQVRWLDPIAHFMREMDNVHLDGTHTFPGSSQRYRQPVLTGRPLRRGSFITHEYVFARNALGNLSTPRGKAGKLSIKPVLTGPYTLAKFSSADSSASGASESVSSLAHRVEAFAEALAAEVKSLAQAGADIIQIDEPAAAAFPEDFPLLSAGLAALASARDSAAADSRRSILALYLYWNDATPLYDSLQDLPVDLLGLDFASAPALPDAVTSSGSSKPLALGFLDGQNPALEDAEAVARKVEAILPRISGGRAHLGTSCGLGLLSDADASAKLSLLSRIQSLVLG